MVIRVNGVYFIAPGDKSFHVPEELSVGKGETNSWTKQYFLECNSFYELENSLVWDVPLSEEFGFSFSPIIIILWNFIILRLYHKYVRNCKIRKAKATCSRWHGQELWNFIWIQASVLQIQNTFLKVLVNVKRVNTVNTFLDKLLIKKSVRLKKN